MLTIMNCENFYTTSLEATEENDTVDQIMIDHEIKEYFLQKNCDDHITDGYSSMGKEFISFPVSRFVFDIILDGVKKSGFTAAIYVR